jgi:hypothetical protein
LNGTTSLFRIVYQKQLTHYLSICQIFHSFTFAHDNNKLTIKSALSSGATGAGYYEGTTFDFVAMEILEETGFIEDEVLNQSIIPIQVIPKYLSDFRRMYY